MHNLVLLWCGGRLLFILQLERIENNYRMGKDKLNPRGNRSLIIGIIKGVENSWKLQFAQCLSVSHSLLLGNMSARVGF